MLYKSGVPIIVSYQAAAVESAATIKMDVYDEAHVLDAVKSVAAMTELGVTGRYWASFTPDAVGEWIILMYEDGGGGEVVKAFRVGTADEFGIKAVVDSVETKVDTVDTVVDGIATTLATPATFKADVSALATVAKQDIIDTNVDDIETILGTPANFKADVSALATAAALTTVDNEIATIDSEVGAIQTDLSNATDGLGAIKTAVDALAIPAMAG